MPCFFFFKAMSQKIIGMIASISSTSTVYQALCQTFPYIPCCIVSFKSYKYSLQGRHFHCPILQMEEPRLWGEVTTEDRFDVFWHESLGGFTVSTLPVTVSQGPRAPGAWEPLLSFAGRLKAGGAFAAVVPLGLLVVFVLQTQIRGWSWILRERQSPDSFLRPSTVVCMHIRVSGRGPTICSVRY